MPRRAALGELAVLVTVARVACWKDFAWVPTKDRKDLTDAISWSIEEIRDSERETTEGMIGKEITTWVEGGPVATFKVLRTWHKKYTIVPKNKFSPRISSKSFHGWIVHLMDLSAWTRSSGGSPDGPDSVIWLRHLTI